MLAMTWAGAASGSNWRCRQVRQSLPGQSKCQTSLRRRLISQKIP